MPVIDKPHASYSATEFSSLFDRESSTVEFKKSTSGRPLQEAIVAMSNTDGGVIFIGIDDQGVVRGCRLDQGVEESINQAALEAHDVGRYTITATAVGTTHITVITVQARSQGFAQTSDGRTLQRRGPRNHALIGAELQDFINRRALRRFERTDSGLLIDRIDRALFQEVRTKLAWPDDEAPSSDRLEERGLAEGRHLTFAGALMLTRPSESLHLVKATIEVRRYPDESTEYDRRVVFDGPLQTQVSDASEFVSGELGSDLIVSGLYRYDIPRLPEVVVREAIANAVAHRSYEDDRRCIVIELRPDRLIIVSPGGLPEPVTVRTLRFAQSARNPAIIAILRAFDLAEDAGRGIGVIQDSMRAAMLDPPRFDDDGATVSVTLPLRGPITPRERAYVRDLERQGEIVGDDRLLVVHAARGELLTNSAAREILGTEDRGAARRALQRLRDVGVFEQIGERSSATYRLVARLAPPAAYRLGPSELTQLVIDAARERHVRNADVRELTGLDRVQATRLLGLLVKQGQLTRHGTRRGTSYSAL